uniref:Uncharacterized protein n=1 Tax=Amphimedon queenslandica TaxID=400682 RepID=A0A1X7SYH5_AMPQE
LLLFERNILRMETRLTC